MRFTRSHLALAAFAGLTLGFAPCLALGQAPSLVRLRVTDSAHVAVAGAEVSVVRGLGDAIARGTTDADGRLTLTVTPTDDDYEVVVRKVGFLRGDRFFPVGRHESVAVDVVMARNLHALDAVNVTEQADLRARSYYIDADAIANSSRPLFSALDVVNKLRPDMVWSLAGRPQNVAGSITSSGRRAARPNRFGDPPATSDIWVNGTRVVFALGDAMAFARRNSGITSALPLQVQYVLSEIKPEHIAEMSYKDPADMSVGMTHSNNALFIILKPGVGYSPGTGSYVIDDPASNLGGSP